MRFLKRKKKIAFSACLLFILLTITPVHALAAPTSPADDSSTTSSSSGSNGWIDADSRSSLIYGTNSHDALEKNDDDDEPGIIDKYVGGFVHSIANIILNTFLITDDIDLSIDGVVLGRMSPGTDVSYTRFELSTGNPYGIIGAWIFVSIRTVVYSFFLIYFVAVLISQLLHNGNKGRAELKDFLYSTIFYFALMYFLPYIIDYVIYVFDVLLYTITNNFSHVSGGAGVSGGIMAVWEQNYQDHPSFVFAVLYLATVFAGLFFFANYVGTALIQTVLFGAIPAVCLIGTRNKKLVSTWTGTFFPNLMIPLIDGILLMVPSMLSWVFSQNTGGDAGAVASIAITMIELIAIWAVIPSRNAILHALGALTGVGAPKTGMMGLAALGMMAAKGMAKTGKRVIGGNRSGGGEEKGGFLDSMDQAKNDAATGEIYNEANQKLNESTVEDINSILGRDSAGDASSMPMSRIGMDQDFAEGLNGQDVGRYENLSARDTMSRELAENKAVLDENGFDSVQASAESIRLSSRNDEIDKELSSISEQRGDTMHSPDGADIVENDTFSQREQQLLAEKEQNTSRMDEIKKNQQIESRNKELETGIRNCDKREASYAANNDMVGMDGKKFNSADEFKTQRQVDDNRRKMINYKNFDSGNFDKLITPDEKAKYERERAFKEVVNPKRIAGVAAGAAIGTVGAAAMAYGGPQSMMTGAVGGYMAGNAASNVAIETPSNIRRTAEYAAPVVKKTASAVANATPDYTANKFVNPRPVRNESLRPVPSGTGTSERNTRGYDEFKDNVRKFNEQHKA